MTPQRSQCWLVDLHRGGIIQYVADSPTCGTVTGHLQYMALDLISAFFGMVSRSATVAENLTEAEVCSKTHTGVYSEVLSQACDWVSHASFSQYVIVYGLVIPSAMMEALIKAGCKHVFCVLDPWQPITRSLRAPQGVAAQDVDHGCRAAPG